MGCGIMRVEKRARAAVYGLQIEANRTQADHDEDGRDFAASDIDWTRTAENEHLIKTEKWNQAISERLKREGLKPRKDSIVMLDSLYTASPEFFEGKSRDEIMQFFRDCLDFHIRMYCQNDRSRVLNAVVHFDETTPHLQLHSIPIHEDEDGRMHLSAKIVMGGRGDYQKRQDAFFEQVTKKYGLERGELHAADERRKHKLVRDWQIEEQEKKLAELDAAMQSIENERTEKAAAMAKRKEKGVIQKSVVYEVPESAWAVVKHAAKLTGRAIDSQRVAEERAAAAEDAAKDADERAAKEKRVRENVEKQRDELRERFAFIREAPEYVEDEARKGVERIRQNDLLYQRDLQRDCVRAFITFKRGQNSETAFSDTIKMMASALEDIGVHGEKAQGEYIKKCLSAAGKQIHHEYKIDKDGNVKGRKQSVPSRQDGGGSSGGAGGWSAPQDKTDYLHNDGSVVGAGGCPRLDEGHEHEGPWSMLPWYVQQEIEDKEFWASI